MSYKADDNPMSFYRRQLMGKRGDFPTGLLYLFVDFCKAHSLRYSIVNNRIPPKTQFKELVANLAGVVPYPEQKAAGEAAKRYKRGIISAPTGVGKSMIAILIINELKVKTLVVVPSLELKRQLTESLVKAFGEKYVGSKKDNRLITVENIDSLPVKKKADYDCVIIDEFHHSGAKTYRQLNKYAWTGVYYRFGLTATPFRSNDNERLLLESVLSKIIYRISYQTAVTKGYIVPMEAYYIEIPKMEVEGETWPRVYSELVVNHSGRNLTLGRILDQLGKSGVSTICLVKEIRHGQNIQQYSDEAYFINGQDEESRQHLGQFNSREIFPLIGTAGILGEGVDTKPCEWVIHAGLGKSKNAFMQGCGRAFRIYPGKETCKIILIKDPSHKWTKSHFAAQVKTLREEYNVKPIKLDLTKLLEDAIV